MVGSKLKLDQIDFEECLITDLKYGDLGEYTPLKFNGKPKPLNLFAS